MKSLLIILAGLFFCWHFTNISSEGIFQSVIAPIGLFIFIISFAIWLVLNAGFGRNIDNNHGGFGGDGGGFDGGGD